MVNEIMNHSTSTLSSTFQGPSCRQNFSLPESIIYYITKNPSTSRLYLKLIRSCKYFFAKNPITVISCAHFTNDGWKVCYQRKECKIDIEKISTKLWIKNVLEYQFIANPPSIISKIYQSDIKTCYFFQQQITLDELLFLASSATACGVKECTVIDGNGVNVSIEKIVESLPRIKKTFLTINPEVSNMSKDSVKKLLKLPHFSNIDHLYFHEIPDTFDVKAIYEYLKITQKNFILCLQFRDSLSDEYFNLLETIVDDMLETSSSYNYVFPCISIPNLNHEKQNELVKRCSEEFNLWKY